jgi:hypothetical protein
VLANPTIGGAVAAQPVMDNATVNPFSTVTLADLNVTNATPSISPTAPTLTVTVSLGTPSLGTLSLPGNGNGFTANATKGTYSVTGSASAVQTALQNMIFTPTPGSIALGTTKTESFTIAAVDTLGGKTSNATSSVVITPADSAPTGLSATVTTGLKGSATGIVGGTAGKVLATLKPVGPSTSGASGEAYSYSIVSATNNSGGASVLSSLALGTGSNTNQLLVAAGKTLAAGTYSIELSVRDNAGGPFLKTFTLTVPNSTTATVVIN